MKSKRKLSNFLEDSVQEKCHNSGTEKCQVNNELPLHGKHIYLDISKASRARLMAEMISDLGAIKETFLGKDVNYVISSTAPPRMINHIQEPAQGDCQSPSSSLFVNTPSPVSVAVNKNATFKNPDGKVVPMTRGQTMAQLARSNSRSPSPSSIVVRAQKLGIKVVSVEDDYVAQVEICFLPVVTLLPEGSLHIGCPYLQLDTLDHRMEPSSPRSKRRLKSENVKRRSLVAPYIKVESMNRTYRPQFAEMNDWPYIYLNTASTTCPFDGKGITATARTPPDEKGVSVSTWNVVTPEYHSTTTVISQRRTVDNDGGSKPLEGPRLTSNQSHRQPGKKHKGLHRHGFCECCNVKYDNIDKHVNQRQHRQYARNKQNYEELDKLIDSCSSTGEFLSKILLRSLQSSATHVTATDSGTGEENPEGTPLAHDAPVVKMDTLQQSTLHLQPSNEIVTDITNCLLVLPDSPATSDKTPHKELSPGLSHSTAERTAAGGNGVQSEVPRCQAVLSDGCDPAKQCEVAVSLPMAVVVRRHKTTAFNASPRRRPSQYAAVVSPVLGEVASLSHDAARCMKGPEVSTVGGDVSALSERVMVFRDSPIASLQHVSRNQDSIVRQEYLPSPVIFGADTWKNG